jgi:hypothetical protein
LPLEGDAHLPGHVEREGRVRRVCADCHDTVSPRGLGGHEEAEVDSRRPAGHGNEDAVVVAAPFGKFAPKEFEAAIMPVGAVNGHFNNGCAANDVTPMVEDESTQHLGGNDGVTLPELLSHGLGLIGAEEDESVEVDALASDEGEILGDEGPFHVVKLLAAAEAIKVDLRGQAPGRGSSLAWIARVALWPQEVLRTDVGEENGHCYRTSRGVMVTRSHPIG